MSKVEDTKVAGPKTKDSKRLEDADKVRGEELSAEERASRSAEEVNAMATEEGIAGADQHLSDVTSGHVFGDNTSSSGGANNPGQHGRDGGTINGEENNPVPTDPTPEAPPPEEDGSAGDESGTVTDLGLGKENKEKPEIKKL